MVGLSAASACLCVCAAKALPQLVAIAIITPQNSEAAKQMEVKVEML